MKPKIVVIGAGIGGLTAAATLAKAGLDVTVLEAHLYPGGCAGTFYHQGFRFDAGATLAAGFYTGGPMDTLGSELAINWPIHHLDPVMNVHLPKGRIFNRWSDKRRWAERDRVFGKESRTFWDWQEATADAMWSLARLNPPWPPQSISEGYRLVQIAREWLRIHPYNQLHPELFRDGFTRISKHLRGQPETLKMVIDGQLLISTQATSEKANALYGAAALDLPRRGAAYLRGGMGTLGDLLARSIGGHGGTVHYRKKVKRVVFEKGRPVAVETEKNESFPADLVIFNLPPWNIRRLSADLLPHKLRDLTNRPEKGWGAFTVYLGVEGGVIPKDFPLHHQILSARPLGEANSLFLSLSPEWDFDRAPLGMRAATISTHTNMHRWWELAELEPSSYEQRKSDYVEKVFRSTDKILPGIREASQVILPGTPLAFERFTGRASGWVGGFPQTRLLNTWAPRLGAGLWMVGDSIFPGQSTAAVALGALRVAKSMIGELEIGAISDRRSAPLSLKSSIGQVLPARVPVRRNKC